MYLLIVACRNESWDSLSFSQPFCFSSLSSIFLISHDKLTAEVLNCGPEPHTKGSKQRWLPRSPFVILLEMGPLLCPVCWLVIYFSSCSLGQNETERKVWVAWSTGHRSLTFPSICAGEGFEGEGSKRDDKEETVAVLPSRGTCGCNGGGLTLLRAGLLWETGGLSSYCEPQGEQIDLLENQKLPSVSERRWVCTDLPWWGHCLVAVRLDPPSSCQACLRFHIHGLDWIIKSSR